ncbi:long-chain-fatty-acid--CoA ligase [Rhizorhapis suberifaciens]|uniref:3-methylmercaptopropionyl-CoA ligase n=1 Tax=Rhizorhapis suberifaciens TaxID=13656 RepID=A0A840HQE7_9SPHN|nr:long-chain-fatty-acid--CoA ligase [Rhizorhapis suberifaciens]MBB4640155.1 acyl-CoA synthetase (AMP-forming)/AMP-acid ligase II [Rhizorhapis suberifaciens]
MPVRPYDNIPVPTLHAIVTEHAGRTPDAPAIRFNDSMLSYRQLDARANRVAHSLIRDGVKPGQRIVFLGRNSDAVPLLALGANKAGIVPVPLNWRLAPAEIAQLVRDCEAPIIFAEPDFLPVIEGTDDAQAFRTVSARDLLAEDNWLSDDETPINASADSEAIALQVYTSGTTGHPKGVMLPHRALLGINALRHAVAWDSWGPKDVTLVQTPLGHIGAFGGLARALYFGALAIIHESFDAAATLSAIERDKVSKLALVPTAIKMILDHPEARTVDYSSLDTIIYGSAPITPTLLREAVATFGCRFAQSYGMSETSGATVALPPEDHDPSGTHRMTGAGKPLPATELKIVGEDGDPLPAGQTGEIWIRSIANMAGYWKLPEESANTLTPDGWVRTGDAGYLEEDGYLYVCGRVKEMIISGAENIYPAEVENAIVSHPGVAEVAVIGLPDPHWGEAVTAIIVLQTGAAADAQAITDWARQQIAGYKVPKAIHFVEALPLNATGKVDKRQLRDQWAAAPLAERA